MKRRAWMYAGVGAAAVAAGAGTAWWRWRLDAPPVGEGLGAFWGATLDSPEGKPVSLAGFRGKPLLVNFWATWCPPCVEELPLINAFYEAQRSRGWQVLGIAIDQPSAVRQWLQRSPLSFPVVLAGLQGTEMSKSLGNQAGGLPFSVLFSAKGEVLERKLGQLHADDLKKWAAKA
jgi:thiol-disulfide isomerase/thioredoxin